MGARGHLRHRRQPVKRPHDRRRLPSQWAYARVFTANAERAGRLPDWIEHYNTRRRHSSLGGLPPISRLSTTW